VTEQEPAPISWEALAAELEATREDAESRGDADPATWDAVARELATRVADRPADEQEPEPVHEPEPLPAPSTEPPAQDPTPPDVPAGEPEPEEPLELLSPEELAGGLEALLFVMDDPVDEPTLATALRCGEDEVRTALAGLAAGLARANKKGS
jgi:segregation and condensation protein B